MFVLNFRSEFWFGLFDVFKFGDYWGWNDYILHCETNMSLRGLGQNVKSGCGLYPKGSCAGSVVPVWWCGTLKLGLGGRIDSIILGRHRWSCGTSEFSGQWVVRKQGHPPTWPLAVSPSLPLLLWCSQGDLLQRPRDTITQSLGCSASKTEFNKPLSFIKHPASGILL